MRKLAFFIFVTWTALFVGWSASYIGEVPNCKPEPYNVGLVISMLVLCVVPYILGLASAQKDE